MNEPDFHLRISSKKTYFIFDVKRNINMNTDIISVVFSSFRKIERHMHDTFKHR